HAGTASGDAAADASDAGAADADAGGWDGNTTSPCPGVPIVPDMSGNLAPGSNAVGIVGSWYAYYDCSDYTFQGLTPMPGVNCSQVNTPTPGGTFAPSIGLTGAPTKLCTSGSTVPASPDDASPPQWSLRWGAGIGLDLNSQGGTKLDYNALDAGASPIKGFCFVLSGNTIPRIRVNLPSDQGITDNWYFEQFNTPGVHQVQFTDPGLRQLTPTNTPFDPSKILSVQFLVPSEQNAAVPWDFCVDQLTAIE
ncbi:MAG TPA: hypothetical protein VE987_10310, partial [Polyangiaceae bacterium]|nr:hypothetical protein [Polyangiaceae bacterium]